MNLLGCAAILAMVVIAVFAIRDWGYKRGYAKGHKDANAWWIGVERDADQARQTIWKEGL